MLLLLLALVQQAAILIVQMTAECKEKGSVPVAGQQAAAVAVGCGALWSALSAWGKRKAQMQEMGRAIRRGRKALTLWMCWSIAPQAASLGLDPSGRGLQESSLRAWLACMTAFLTSAVSSADSQCAWVGIQRAVPQPHLPRHTALSAVCPLMPLLVCW